MTLEQIKAMPIVGNAYHDRAIFNRVHDFVMNDDNDMHERAEALRFVAHDVMGDDRVCDDDERIVNEYIECM